MKSLPFLPFELGFDHFHTVGDTSLAVAAPEAFQLVLDWPDAMILHQGIESAAECSAWVYIRIGSDGEPLSEAVQFISLRPDLIDTTPIH